MTCKGAKRRDVWGIYSNLILDKINKGMKFVKCTTQVPGIVLSRIKPVNPPTNMLVPSKTLNNWSTISLPKYN